MVVDIHAADDRGNILTTQEELVVQFNGKTLIVPAGFECDGTSVPRFLWSVVSPQIHPETLRAAIAHDYLYRHAPSGWTRKEADELFYDFCRADGLSWAKSQYAYWALRIFGGAAWKGGES